MDVLYKTFSSQNKNIHEQYLRLIQQNYISEFERLLENANEKSVPQKYIEFLEVYKYLNGLSSDILNTVFKFKLRQNTYNLRNFHTFQSQNPGTIKFVLDIIAYRASQLWKNVPHLSTSCSPDLRIYLTLYIT